MSVTCELCGREFKNTQGLRGHKTFYHNMRSSSNTPVQEHDITDQYNDLEDRIYKLEYITGLRPPSILDKYLFEEKSLSLQLAEITEQLDSLTQQIASLSNNTPSITEFREMKRESTQLGLQLSNLSKRVEHVSPVADTVDLFEKELRNKAQNTCVKALENRLSVLEEEIENKEELINRNIDEAKAVIETKIRIVMNAVDHAVNKLVTSIQQLQKQLREQKQVADWVKKEYKLRPMKK